MCSPCCCSTRPPEGAVDQSADSWRKVAEAQHIRNENLTFPEFQSMEALLQTAFHSQKWINCGDQREPNPQPLNQQSEPPESVDCRSEFELHKRLRLNFNSSARRSLKEISETNRNSSSSSANVTRISVVFVSVSLCSVRGWRQGVVSLA